MNQIQTDNQERKQAMVVIVGRPNVGKSTLFNRILGQREAIVDDQPGVTRDVKIRITDWNGKSFRLVDTGGFFGPDEDPLTPFVQEQIERTARTASVLLLVLDGRIGPTPLDHEVIKFLRPLKVPILAAVNKVDNYEKSAELIAPFYELGLDAFCPISALHGTNTGDLLDLIADFIPEDAVIPQESDLPAIAILGRPNVGKSTLLNSLCGSERSIVSPIAGTTRDPVDMEIEALGKKYLLIDTAGIRRRSKMHQGLDYFSLLRAEESLKRCHLALLLIDAVEGLTETDAKVFGLTQKYGKAAIILVNKWDAVEKDENSAGTFAKDIRDRIPFLHYAPIEFISAMTQKRIHRIFPHVERILERYFHRVPTGELNRLMETIRIKNPPPIHKGRSPRIYYWTQVAVGPPTFVAFCSDPNAIHFSYERFLVNQLYDAFDFAGTPIRLFLRGRGSQEPE